MAQVMTDMLRRHCYFTGRVQGVGFRYAARNIAINYNVAGFVRNLPDGRVEVVAEGPGREADSFITAIQDRMRGFITRQEKVDEPPTGEFAAFTIAR